MYLVKNQNRFMSTDSNSGYPTEVQHPWDALIYNDLRSALAMMRICAQMYPSARVVKFTYRIEEVAQDDIEQDQYDAAIAKLTDDEIQLILKRHT